MNSIESRIEDGEKQPKVREFILYFLRLRTFGFGGPIALAGHMQRDLVEERKWVSRQDYLEGWRFHSFLRGHWRHNWRCISVG
jgi:chromate transport protein ChrA